MGFLLGSGKKAAKEQAAATLKAADMQATQDRLVAQAAQNSRETMLAQDQASRAAAELLSKPQGKVDVSLAADTGTAEIDPTTRRRRTARSRFTAQTPTSGINI